VLRFAYRLAVKLGRVNVRQMLSEISNKELIEWMVFADLEPFDEERADVRAAAIRATLLNIHRRQGTPVVTPLECMTHFGDSEPPPHKQTWQEQKAICRMYSTMVGGEPRGR